jgi:nitrite reductase/ring-hydroxylating ferredoxin subunit
MGQLVKIANTEDVPEGHGIAAEAAGRKVALFHVDGKYFAVDGTCTHRGGPLAEGELNGNVVTCPWHGANFDVTSGEALSPPAQSGVTCYKVQLDGSEIKIEVP